MLFILYQKIKKKTEPTLSAEKQESLTQENHESDQKSLVLKKTYASILLGEPAANGSGGSPYSEIKAFFGKPIASFETEIAGIMTKIVAWDHLQGGTKTAALTVHYVNNLAVVKNMTGMPFAKHLPTLLKKYEQTPADASLNYSHAVELFGEPDSLAEAMNDGMHSITATWLTHLTGSNMKTMIFQFENQQAISKPQTGLK